MTKLREKAFYEAQKLSADFQDEIVHQLLFDIENELKWRETLSNPHLNGDNVIQMAEMALREDEEGKRLMKNDEVEKP